MLYTRKGDDGTTKKFDTPKGERVSKGSLLFEALGSVDEINSFLGLCKVKSKDLVLKTEAGEYSSSAIIDEIQKNLFIAQAEIAGSTGSPQAGSTTSTSSGQAGSPQAGSFMAITEEKVKELERIIDAIEKELPPIKTFFVAGGSEIATLFDIARVISRRTERNIIRAIEAGELKISGGTKAYINRLSSILYALARLANHKFGITEQAPDYK